jgi:hypothetical protein
LSFIPPHNAPGEMKDWANWVQKRDAERKARDAEQDRLIAMLLKEMNAGARLTTLVNNRLGDLSTATSGVRGLPDGGVDGNVLRVGTTTPPFWGADILNQMGTYFIDLKAGDDYWLRYAGEANQTNVAAILPAAEITDGGTTLEPLANADMDFFPVNLVVTVEPATDLEEFTLNIPNDNWFGNGAPFWSLQLENKSDTNRARVNIAGAALIYAGTNIPVNGDESVWDIDPDYRAAWFVSTAYFSVGTAVTPMSVSEATYPARQVLDPFYMRDVAGRRHMFPYFSPGTVTVAELPFKPTNDETNPIFISCVRATVGTAPTGANMIIDVLLNGTTSVLDTPLVITAGTTTGVGTVTTTSWASGDIAVAEWVPGDFLTVEVTQVGSTVPGSDLTVQVWAG